MLCPHTLNILAPAMCSNNSKSVLFELNLRVDILSISCEIGLGWVPYEPTDDKSTLLKVMTWCCQQQAIIWANIDPDKCRHMASLEHNVLILTTRDSTDGEPDSSILHRWKLVYASAKSLKVFIIFLHDGSIEIRSYAVCLSRYHALINQGAMSPFHLNLYWMDSNLLEDISFCMLPLYRQHKKLYKLYLGLLLLNWYP